MSVVGKKCRAVVIGKTALNGVTHSMTFTTDVAEIQGDATIYDAMRFLTYHVERLNAEMEYPESIEMAIADDFEDDD